MQQADRLHNWRRLAICVVFGVAAVAAIYLFRGIPQVAAVAMRNAESFELLSLDPEKGGDDADFHEFKVLGRATVTDPAMRKRLYGALQSGARWNLSSAARCFMPRHGIRVLTQGRTVDLVICFECNQVRVWEDDSQVKMFIVSRSPEPVFDQALRDTGLPLAPK